MKVDAINFDDLKKMAKALNEATYGEEGASFLEKKLKTIAVSKAALAIAFDKAIRDIDDEITGELPEEIIDFYNANFSEVAGEEPTPEPTEKKETKAPAEKKAKKVTELSVFGHKLGSQAATLDDLLNTGKPITLEDLSKKSGRSLLGVKGHIKHLTQDKGVSSEVKDGGYQRKEK